MAVYQTRAYFLEKFGYLTDNPEIGPLLAKHYWHAGNHLSHNETIFSLTGEALTPSTLQTCVTYPPEQAWEVQQKKIDSLATRKRAPVASLDATIKVVDGSKELASNAISDEQMCDDFERYIVETYGR